MSATDAPTGSQRFPLASPLPVFLKRGSDTRRAQLVSLGFTSAVITIIGGVPTDELPCELMFGYERVNRDLGLPGVVLRGVITACDGPPSLVSVEFAIDDLRNKSNSAAADLVRALAANTD